MTGQGGNVRTSGLSAAPSETERAERLTQGALALGLTLAADEQDRLLAYLGLLAQWNKVYNLTALRRPDEMLSHHLLDCLAALPALRRHAAGRPLRVLDVGSGGGLPGVVLAVMQPDWTVTCVDTVGKKTSFIRQVATELTLPNLRAVHGRVEQMADTAGGFNLVTSRAFASLADFTRLTGALLSVDGVWAAMKGQAPDDEQSALPPDVQVFHVEQLTVPGLDARRCLVWMKRRSA